MTIDYGTLRQPKPSNEGGTELFDIEDTELAVALREVDLPSEELMVRVVASQDNEFICTTCLLVHDRRNLAEQGGNVRICSDCA
jgi:hypothetical protein